MPGGGRPIAGAIGTQKIDRRDQPDEGTMTTATEVSRPIADRAVRVPVGGWEHFPHDADVGIRGIGPTKADAFAQAAVALTAIIAEPATIRPVQAVNSRFGVCPLRARKRIRSSPSRPAERISGPSIFVRIVQSRPAAS